MSIENEFVFELSNRVSAELFRNKLTEFLRSECEVVFPKPVPPDELVLPVGSRIVVKMPKGVIPMELRPQTTTTTVQCPNCQTTLTLGLIAQ